MRILQAISTVDAIGGAQRQLLAVMESLARDGLRCDVAWYIGKGELAPDLARCAGELHPFTARRFDPLGIARTARRIRTARYDVVHLHLSRAEIVGSAAVMALEALGVRKPKVVLHKHNEDRWWSSGVLARIHPVITRRADAVVVQSPRLREFYRDPALRVAHPERIEVLPYGIDAASAAVPDRTGARAAIRADERIDADAPVGLAVVRLTAQKRIDVMLDAWARVVAGQPRAVLLIAGRGELEDDLKARASSLPAGAVRFLGFRADIPALMAASDALVLSSDWEGVPMALLQAMAAELPIVSTDVAGIGDTLAHPAEALLMPPRDPAALAAAVLETFRHRDAARARAVAAAARARRELSLDGIAGRWRALYERLLGGVTVATRT